MNKEKKKLYRKVNTKARGIFHHKGSDARHDRNTKNGISTKMKHGVKRGLDYTPLYKFLLSKIGESFDTVFSEALERLDGNKEPIFHMVINPETENLKYHGKRDYVRSGEGAIYSALYIDENNLLQLVNPKLTNDNFAPSCSCCTYTFNGKLLIRKYSPTDSLPPNVHRV